MKKKLISRIYDYINRHFDANDIELSLFISENLHQIETELKLSADDYESVLDSCLDNTSDSYLLDFVPAFKTLCAGNNNRLLIKDYEGSFILSLNDYARYYDKELAEHYCNLLQKLCKSSNYIESSIQYEKFCQKWFVEFGADVHTTARSNDRGVDLVGFVENSTVFADIAPRLNVRVLAQIKLYDNPIDTSYIRKFLGDVVFLTFDEGDISIFAPTVLFFIGHNGFTKAAKEFSIRHNVLLLDSRDLIRTLAIKGDLRSYDCIKYLDSMGLSN